MKLVGIIDTEGFKAKVLKQRELLMTEDKKNDVNGEVNSAQFLSLLTEIKDILTEIKNK